MMNSGPTRTEAQRTGQHAEAAFALAVTEAGLIWHPASAGNDFGIDGTVELVTDGTVGGAEFNVQIKGTTTGTRRIGTVDLGLVKLTTMSYWMTKLRPTLLVVHDQVADTLFYGWLDDIVAPVDVFERQIKQFKRMRLRMPAKALTPQTWKEVRSDALKAHEALQAAFTHAPVQSYYHILYCLTADVTDILTDAVTDLAFSSPLILTLLFGQSEANDDLLNRFEAEMPAPPEVSLRNANFFAITMMLEALDHELQAFLVGKFMFRENNPIVRSTESVQRTLHGLLSDMIHHLPDANQVESKSPGEPTLEWARLDVVKFVYGVGLILVLLRDYQRELRPFLFPVWGHILWPFEAEKGAARLAMSTIVIRDMAAGLVTSFGSRQSSQGSAIEDDGGSPTDTPRDRSSVPDSDRGRLRARPEAVRRTNSVQGAKTSRPRKKKR